jgi:hypothetical protein
MAQEILNNVSADWKGQAKHIRFYNGTSNPAFSNNLLDVYFNLLDGELSLSQFPNIKTLTFNSNSIDVTNLESIDISENLKLSKIDLCENGSAYHALKNSSCNLLIREGQLNQVVVRYYKYKHSTNSSGWTQNWIEKYKLMKDQTIVPYTLVEGGKTIEQLEEEVKRLNQVVAGQDQQIEKLEKENAQTPTLSQFKELVDIVISPDTSLDFNNLKHEIKKLKLKDILPNTQKEKENFKKLIKDAKDKTGDNLDKFLDLLLQIQKQIIERGQETDSFAQGQVDAYQNILQEKLSYNELQTLLNEQKKILKLEKQLLFLQTQENATETTKE